MIHNDFIASPFKRHLPLVVAALLLVACHSPQKNGTTGFTVAYQPTYATGFYIEKKDDEKLLHVFNPWQGATDVEFVYRLCPRARFDRSLPMNCLPVPLQRVVCLSTTHIAFIDCIGQTETIVGVSGAGYVSNPAVGANFRQGRVRDVGYETLLSYETIVALQPDVVFAYGVNGEMAAVVGKLNEIGVRVVYLADYLEENLLGKAEYMVAVAAFYNEEAAAGERFSAIAAEYRATAETVRAVAHRPAVILNAPWRDTWYMPGEKSTFAQLLHDAGAQAIGLGRGRNSRPVGLETAYTFALQADYWLHPNAMRSLQELKEADARFANIPAFVRQQVYNNTRRSTPRGGSDFWESGAVRPHLILQDLVHIFHPEILPEHEPVYYEKLQ
jgi:iron complex transport system substrate-binding protein